MKVEGCYGCAIFIEIWWIPKYTFDHQCVAYAGTALLEHNVDLPRYKYQPSEINHLPHGECHLLQCHSKHHSMNNRIVLWWNLDTVELVLIAHKIVSSVFFLLGLVFLCFRMTRSVTVRTLIKWFTLEGTLFRWFRSLVATMISEHKASFIFCEHSLKN